MIEKNIMVFVIEVGRQTDVKHSANISISIDNIIGISIDSIISQILI
jgi:hypothetical protein